MCLLTVHKQVRNCCLVVFERCEEERTSLRLAGQIRAREDVGMSPLSVRPPVRPSAWKLAASASALTDRRAPDNERSANITRKYRIYLTNSTDCCNRDSTPAMASFSRRTTHSTANSGDEEEVGLLLGPLDTLPGNTPQQQRHDEDADIESESEENAGMMPPSAQPHRRSVTTESRDTMSRTEDASTSTCSRVRSPSRRGRPTKKRMLALDVEITTDQEEDGDEDGDGSFWPVVGSGAASGSALHSDNTRELKDIFSRHVDRLAWNLLQKRTVARESGGIDLTADEGADSGDDYHQHQRERGSSSASSSSGTSPPPDSASSSSAASSISFNAHEDDEPVIQLDQQEDGTGGSNGHLREAHQHTLLDPSVLRPLTHAIGSSMGSLFKHLHTERQKKAGSNKGGSSILSAEDVLRVLERSSGAGDDGSVIVDRVKARLGVATAVAEKQPQGPQVKHRKGRTDLDRELLLDVRARRK